MFWECIIFHLYCIILHLKDLLRTSDVIISFSVFFSCVLTTCKLLRQFSAVFSKKNVLLTFWRKHRTVLFCEKKNKEHQFVPCLQKHFRLFLFLSTRAYINFSLIHFKNVILLVDDLDMR